MKAPQSTSEKSVSEPATSEISASESSAPEQRASDNSRQDTESVTQHDQSGAQQQSSETGPGSQADKGRDAAMDPDVRLAWWLDNGFRLPGGFRIGLDGVIGLVPGVGDLAGAGLSSWVIYRAYRRGAPLGMLCKMVFNVLIDTVIGAIPLLGDLFDFVWQANQRNAVLLRKHLEKQHR